ncbi:hypothetical protein BA896_017570 [Janthinobacterium lividum]|uniref:Secreted protein n=1 Tax=Janthinobacterium lividum TaxID=29581 RepID=A0A1E8PM15_9BURK|nr:hypothetical protein BA896_017570 [Janthinobacterium lividum]
MARSARCKACVTCAAFAPARPSVTFWLTEAANTCARWPIQAMRWRKVLTVLSFRRTPPMRISPPLAGSKPANNESKVVLPAPLAPSKATCSPACTVKSKPSNTRASPG